MSLAIRFLSLAALAAALPAAATFHLWSMSELYTNSDGTVQFLELQALSSGQQFVAGHTLRVTAGTSRSFAFPRDLPGDSSGRRMLIGTQGFAALGVVTPDFIVPNGFFPTTAGTIDFAEGADTWNIPAPPLDGTNSLSRSGATVANSPRNFAGATGMVVPAPPAVANYQGLWWGAPAGAEAGWGLNIAQQGDTLFATWFTYDAQGRGMWLALSDTRRESGQVFNGPIHRVTGPPFNAVPFNPQSVVPEQVGNATLAFSDEGTGTFRYTVGTVTQTKAITRQVFASPVPSCNRTNSFTPQDPNLTDLWWASPAGSESGWGINFTHQGDVVFATWFTYGADGRGQWLVMSEGRRTAPNVFTGALYRTTGPAFDVATWNPALVTRVEVGTLSITYSQTDPQRATLSYTLDGVSQVKPIVRQVFSSPPTVCR